MAIGEMTAAKGQAEADLSHSVQVTLCGETHEVIIPRAAVPGLVQALQQTAIDIAFADAKSPHLPQFDAVQVLLALQPHDVALLVTTAQAGPIVIRVPPELLPQLQRKLAELVANQAAASNPQ